MADEKGLPIAEAVALADDVLEIRAAIADAELGLVVHEVEDETLFSSARMYPRKSIDRIQITIVAPGMFSELFEESSDDDS